MSNAKVEVDKPTPPAPEYKMRSERRAARVAQEKIAESAKYLASNKIMATTSPPPPTKPRNRVKKPSPAVNKSPTMAANSNVRLQLTGHTTNTSGFGTYGSPQVSRNMVSVSPQIKLQQGTSFRTAAVPFTIRPQMFSGKKPLPKIPILVFNSLGSSLPTIIPISASPLSSNTIVTLAGNRTSLTSTTSVIKPMQNVVTLIKTPLTNAKAMSSTASSSSPSSTVNTISSKFLTYNSTTKPTISLTMECEEETLSSAQWLKYRKAESEYMEVLRKLIRWKGRSDVEIVHLGPDDPTPPIPRFLNVQEASRQPVPDVPVTTVTDDDVVNEMDTNSKESMELTPTVKFEDSRDKTSTNSRPNTVTITPAPSPPKQAKVQPSPEETASTSSASQTAKQQATPSLKLPVSIFKTRSESQHAVLNELTLYPELMVHMDLQNRLKEKDLAIKKAKLDVFIKKLMTSGKESVDRWMLEKGLFGTKRSCLAHSKLQMRLMFLTTDGSIKPGDNTPINDGQYKWWCKECAKMVPIDQGSFFGIWRRTHRIVLRIIYHWACNTDIKMVIREMRDDKEFVNSVYASIRDVCNRKSVEWLIGGPGHPVEIACKELGTCKDAKDVVLYCAYDRATKQIKLCASSASTRRSEIVSLFRVLVERESYIYGDNDLRRFLPTHLQNNFMCNVSDHIVNQNASEYLDNYALPTILSVNAALKLHSIQSLMNELSWRETFGRDPLAAYNHILLHIKQLYASSVISTRSLNSMPFTSTTGSGAKALDINRLRKNPHTYAKIAPEPVTKTNELRIVNVKSLAENKSITENPEKEETVVVDCDLAALVEVYGRDNDTDNNKDEDRDNNKVNNESSENKMANLKTYSKRKISADECLQPSTSKNKKLKSDACIKISDWVPPIGVQLDSYYYAKREGCKTLMNESQAKYKFKCQACKRTLDENTKMMKHIHGHINAVKQFNLDLNDLIQCKYCFRDFASPYAMQTHVEEVHSNGETIEGVLSTATSPICRICDKEFVNFPSLSEHMKTLHVKWEMPYKCIICKYMTSFYRDIINHFDKEHRGTNKLLCIHCLNVFTVRFGSGAKDGRTDEFYKHVYKHQSKSINRRCPKCCLSFLSTDQLLEHRKRDHHSVSKHIGVIPMVSEKSKYVDCNSEGGLYEFKNTQMMCIECKLNMNIPNHFCKTLKCSLCSYVTWCGRAFTMHAIAEHSTVRPVNATRSPTIRAIVCDLICACSFVTTNGNRMAKHLSKCNKGSWCYYSGVESDDVSKLRISTRKLEDKKKNGKGSMMETDVDDDEVDSDRNDDGDNDDDDGDEEMEHEESTPMKRNADDHDQQNMMNVLGLMQVRKSR